MLKLHVIHKIANALFPVIVLGILRFSNAHTIIEVIVSDFPQFDRFIQFLLDVWGECIHYVFEPFLQRETAFMTPCCFSK